jgi:hypothetical protein
MSEILYKDVGSKVLETKKVDETIVKLKTKSKNWLVDLHGRKKRKKTKKRLR